PDAKTSVPLPLQSLSNAETPKAPVTNPNPIRTNQQKVVSSSSSAALSLSSNPCLSLPVEGLVASLRPSSPRRRTKACTELFASPCPSSSSLSLSHCDVYLCSAVEYSPWHHLPSSLTAGFVATM
ncbi:hypothetical protein S83_030369, partial [Arachis hypogaea]